jgi:hypothetical protein
MEDDTRDLINHLGAQLAGIMEDASADAALLRGVEPDRLAAAIEQFAMAAEHAKALTAAMRAIVSRA